MIWGCKVPRLQTSTKMGGDGESDFTLIRMCGKAQASFQRGLDETHCTLWLRWKCLNYLGWSDLKKSARRKFPWYSLLCRDFHCSRGLVIKPDHLWGTESYLHISNEFEECHSQQSRLVLAPTTPSFGCRTIATACTEMPSLVFSAAGTLLHELGESNRQDILSSVSKDHDLLKNSLQLSLYALLTDHKPNRNSRRTLQTD